MSWRRLCRAMICEAMTAPRAYLMAYIAARLYRRAIISMMLADGSDDFK